MRKLNIKKRSNRTLDDIRDLRIPYAGNENAKIIVVLDPVVGNLRAMQPFDQKLFDYLKVRLKDCGGFDRDDILFVSAAPPVTFDTWNQNKAINAHLKEWHNQFQTIVDIVNPKMIIPAGAKACQQVVGRAVQITKVRGQAAKDPDIAGGRLILPILSPFFAMRHPEMENTFNSDLQTAGRLHKNNYSIEAASEQTKTNYRWCDNLKFLLHKRPKRIAVDIEGIGLRGYDPNNCILTVQICYKKGEVLCVPIHYDAGKYRHHGSDHWHKGKLKKILRQLKSLLEDPNIEVVGQNFKFDWLFLKYQLDIEVANYAHDTILLAHLLDENMTTFNLDDLTRIHIPEMAGYNDKLNIDPEHQGKTRMDLLTPDKMLQYACGDADSSFRLVEKLHAQVSEDQGLLTTYNRVSMPAIRAFCHIEQNGFPIDVAALRAFEKELAALQKREKRELLKMLPASIKDEYRDTGVGLKPDRAAILKAYMYTHPDGLQLSPVAFTKTGQPSTSSKDAMPYYAADHPFIARMIDYIKNERLLNTYVQGFYKYIFEGKIRPSYLLHGTVTGRSSSRDPNGQNFPKRGKLVKAYRKIFKAPKGWVFLSLDLSQAELRVAAMMSGDETMLDVYRNDGDIHTRTAMGVMGVDTIEDWLKLPKETRDLKRFQAKAVNFGFLYGMWWPKFRSYAKTEYGIDFTEDEAKEIRELFFRTYPSLEAWHETVQEFVLDHGFVRTYDGRMRHLPMVHSTDESISKSAARMAINSPVQSIASDLGLMALGILLPIINERNYTWLKVCGFIHDAIVCLVREDKVAEATQFVKGHMENLPLEEAFGWKPEIPIKADAEAGRTLSKTYELAASTYEGKKNRKKSYSDLLTDIVNGMEDDLKTAKGDKAEYLKREIETTKADAADKKPAEPRKQSRRLRLQPRPKDNAHISRVRKLRLSPKKKIA